MIQGITFDLDGVYFPNGKQNFIRSLTNLGVSTDEVKRVFLQSEEMNHIYKHGLMSDRDFWTWAAHEWKLNLSPTDLIQLLIDGYDVDSRIAETVRRVRGLGYKTLICSNNFPGRVSGLQEKFHFLDNFDTAVFSYDVGTSKPESRMFTALVEKSGIPAGSIVFADDDERCLTGAKEIGITTLVYTTFDQFLLDLQQLGLAL